MKNPNRRFKDAIYEQFGRVGKAVASPRRIELLDLLCQGPRTVEVLAHQVDQSVANTSRHLRVLHSARLVESERNGSFVTYRLADDEVCSFFGALTRLAESRFAEVRLVAREFFESRETMEPIDSGVLLERVALGEVTMVDVRPRDEYLAGHLAGAISMPLAEIGGRLDELPRDRQIVAYCRSRYCVMAVEAVEVFAASGFDAVRMEDGVLEWQAAGQRVESGAGTQ